MRQALQQAVAAVRTKHGQRRQEEADEPDPVGQPASHTGKRMQESELIAGNY